MSSCVLHDKIMKQAESDFIHMDALRSELRSKAVALREIQNHKVHFQVKTISLGSTISIGAELDKQEFYDPYLDTLIEKKIAEQTRTIVEKLKALYARYGLSGDDVDGTDSILSPYTCKPQEST